MGTTPLRWELWAITFGLAILVLPLGAISRAIPVPLEDWEKPTKKVSVDAEGREIELDVDADEEDSDIDHELGSASDTTK